MSVVHVRITCADDYVARRAPMRQAHIERLLALRRAGALVAGGPDPAGRIAELFYRAPDAGTLRDAADRRLGGSKLLVQLHRGFDDALPGFVLALGAFLQLVLPSTRFHGQ